MQKSIIFMVRVLLFVSLILSALTFTCLMQHKEDSKIEALKKEYFPIFKKVYNVYNRYHFNPIFARKLEDERLKLIDNPNGILYNPKTKILLQRKEDTLFLRLLELNDRHYLYLKRANKIIVLKDVVTVVEDKTAVYYFGFTFFIVLLVFFYMVVLRKLFILKGLREKLSSLSNEHFDFSCCQTDQKDEVSLLGLELKHSAQKLESLKFSRNVVTKDMLYQLSSMRHHGNEEDYDLKLGLDNVLDRFSMIKDLLLESQESLPQRTIFFQELLQQAIDSLSFEDVIVKNDTNINLLLHVESVLFSIRCLLQIINDHSVGQTIEANILERCIVIKADGEQFISDWEAFLKEEKEPDSHFEYLIYLNYHILKLNRYVLSYEYTSDKNQFIIPLDRDDL